MKDTFNSNNEIQPPSNPTNHVNPNPPTVYKDNGTQPEDLDSRWRRWKCLKCGYLYEGIQELKKCPKCGNDNPDLFQDAD